VDYALREWLTLGASAGLIATHSLSSENSDTTDVNSQKFGVYGVAHRYGWNMNGYLGGATDAYTTNRNITFGDINRSATGSTGGREFNTRWSLSREWLEGQTLIEPTASAEYNWINSQAYTEGGAGALDLNVGSQKSSSLRSELGARLSREYKLKDRLFTPYVSATWQHEYDDQSQSINAEFQTGGIPFSVKTSDVGRDTALLGAGMTFQCCKRTSLYFNYLGQVGRANFMAHSFDGGLRVKF
jgi:outer membrane autotransporter protein